MIKITNIILPFDHSPGDLQRAALDKLALSKEDLLSFQISRRSLDARSNRPLRRVYTVLIEVAEEERYTSAVEQSRDLSIIQEEKYQIPFLSLKKRPPQPVIIGTGPAGIFAGLVLAEAGLPPLFIERGKAARQRVRDVDRFWKMGQLDPESNVQFGEGGAGTFSDGKLTTRVKDKHHRSVKILQEMVSAGAPTEILIDNKPHVGTANLVRVVGNLRQKIESLGGEYRFETRMDDLIVDGGRITGLELSSRERVPASILLLAIGHSARDTFAMLSDRGVALAPKPFSVGFRIEHPQLMIDHAQYGRHADHPALSAAEYQLSYRTSSGRTVYSFCMCPGGTVIGASSEVGGLVTNGMSQYARDGVNANSAIVAEVFPEDMNAGPLQGFLMQRSWEQKAFSLGGGGYFAPVQLVEDFINHRQSGQLGNTQPTYLPGIRLVDLDQAFPPAITESIREALRVFNRRIPGFAGPDAVLTGVETRTSCPLRITRQKDGQSVSIKGLYPVGEGSGYAGGIMSSAIDGIKAAEKIIQALCK